MARIGSAEEAANQRLAEEYSIIQTISRLLGAGKPLYWAYLTLTWVLASCHFLISLWPSQKLNPHALLWY